MPSDYYVMDLARIVKPAIVRVADLTTRFVLQHRPSFTNGRPPFDALFTPSQFVGRHPAVVKVIVCISQRHQDNEDAVTDDLRPLRDCSVCSTIPLKLTAS